MERGKISASSGERTKKRIASLSLSLKERWDLLALVTWPGVDLIIRMLGKGKLAGVRTQSS